MWPLYTDAYELVGLSDGLPLNETHVTNDYVDVTFRDHHAGYVGRTGGRWVDKGLRGGQALHVETVQIENKDEENPDPYQHTEGVHQSGAQGRDFTAPPNRRVSYPFTTYSETVYKFGNTVFTQ